MIRIRTVRETSCAANREFKSMRTPLVSIIAAITFAGLVMPQAVPGHSISPQRGLVHGSSSRSDRRIALVSGSGAYPTASLKNPRSDTTGSGQVCPDPKQPCNAAKWDFRPWELSFQLPATLVWNRNYQSTQFYAILLTSTRSVPDDGQGGNRDCSGYVTEKTRVNTQGLFPGRKVFASRFGCSGPGVHYTNTNSDYNFMAVYAGRTREEAAKCLAEVAATGRFPGANVRLMSVVLDYGD